MTAREFRWVQAKIFDPSARPKPLAKGRGLLTVPTRGGRTWRENLVSSVWAGASFVLSARGGLPCGARGDRVSP